MKAVSYRDYKNLCLAFHFLPYVEECDIHIAFSLQTIYIENFFGSDTQAFVYLLCKIKLIRESEHYLHPFLPLCLSPCPVWKGKNSALDFGFPLQRVEIKYSKMNNRVSLGIEGNCLSLSAFKKVSSFILGWLKLTQSTYTNNEDNSTDGQFSEVWKTDFTKHSTLKLFVWM